MRITSKGQVTIPQAIRERYGLLPDTEVEFVESDGKVSLVPRPTTGNDRGSRAIARLRGSASTDLSTEEIFLSPADSLDVRDARRFKRPA